MTHPSIDPIRPQVPAVRRSMFAWMRQLVGSVLFYLGMWISVLIYAPPMLLTFLLPFPARFYLISRWSVLQLWMLKVFCGIRHEVHGRENIPRGPAVIMAKHQSTWETLAFALIFPPQTWVLKRDLMWVPLFGWALALLKPIAIDRGSKRAAVQQVIAQGRERLQEGIWIIVFPEGTRMSPGEHRRWGRSGAALAAAAGVPVVPVAHNAGHYWRRRRFLKDPGTIQAYIGPAIEPRGRSDEEILNQAEQWVANVMARLEGKALTERRESC
ncbi:MAG: lysophospholipid acyltransferase family protein [Sulfurifustis sp.]